MKDKHSLQGQWQAKIYAKDFKNNRSAFADLDIIAIYPTHLRIEATGNMGLHVLSLTMKDKTLNYYLPQQDKKIRSGPVSDRVFKEILGVSLHPQLLMKIIFDRDISDDSWLCLMDELKQNKSCKNEKLALDLNWTERKENSMKIQINSEQNRVNILLERIQPKVQFNDETFSLKKTIN